MHRPAEAQLDLTAREVLEDLAGVGQRPGETVELGDHERVTAAAGGERLA